MEERCDKHLMHLRCGLLINLTVMLCMLHLETEAQKESWLQPIPGTSFIYTTRRCICLTFIGLHQFKKTNLFCFWHPNKLFSWKIKPNINEITVNTDTIIISPLRFSLSLSFPKMSSAWKTFQPKKKEKNKW